MVTFIIILLLIAAIVGLYAITGLGALLVIAFLFGYNKQRKKLCHELHAAYQFPWPDDASKCQDAIRSFLRNVKKSLPEPSPEIGEWKIPSESSSDLHFFIRMCHALGCEIVVRRVADHDIENNPDDPRFEKVQEYMERVS